ncbi:MAG: hypothetical protein M3430_05245 [Acidobacteriota bacterium]|nr:hypothetical protein [Acidobacteriota bacterium]
MLHVEITNLLQGITLEPVGRRLDNGINRTRFHLAFYLGGTMRAGYAGRFKDRSPHVMRPFSKLYKCF